MRPTMPSSQQSPTSPRREERGKDYTVFTDSVATMTRVISDAPGPGQDLAIRIIDLT